MFIAQPTLSQQIRRLEEIVGTPLLQRRRDGLRLTKAGTILLDSSRNVLSLVDHAVSRTRQAAGLGRQRLRVVVPPQLPDLLAVPTASALLSAAAAADVDVLWMETSLDAEFSLIRQHRADAGLGWLTTSPDALAAPLDVLSLGEFEPLLWIPSSHAAAHRGSISLAQIARTAVVHGPRRAEAGTYDAWMRVLRAVDPRFEFTDSPFRQSLPMALAFAATGDRPTAVLTGPSVIAGTQPGLVRLPRPAGIHDMVRVTIDNHPLTATAALVWSGDLPCPLRQILFQTADGITAQAPCSMCRAGPGEQRHPPSRTLAARLPPAPLPPDPFPRTGHPWPPAPCPLPPGPCPLAPGPWPSLPASPRRPIDAEHPAFVAISGSWGHRIGRGIRVHRTRRACTRPPWYQRAPPGSAVSLRDRLAGRVRAYGMPGGSMVHKPLPQAQTLPDLDARRTKRPLSAASWPQRSADGPGRTRPDLACGTEVARNLRFRPGHPR